MKKKILLLLLLLQIISPLLTGLSAQSSNEALTNSISKENNNKDNEINSNNIEIESNETIEEDEIINSLNQKENSVDVNEYQPQEDEFELVKYNAINNISKNSVIEEVPNNEQHELKKNSGKSVLINRNNGKTISTMESGTFMTIGGINKISYMYSSLEDAFNQINGVSINGAGYDGKYFNTINYNGIDFVNIEISGFKGYMNINDVQLIPNNLLKAKSHYVLENGKWLYKAAVDSLISEEYINYNLGASPLWAKEGIRYFSTDGKTFSEENGSSRTLLSSSNYFQNLPVRSTTTYNANTFKQFLLSKGFGGSQYINSTDAFIEAEKLTGINGMFLFAFANHEGYYGTSFFSKQCNNFYGRGAYDSTPENACKQFGFTEPRDGILAQGLFLQNMYANIDNWVYYGSHVGNKGSGMNVKYASDPNWGIRIANMMNEIDIFGGRTDLNRFRIAQVNANNLPVFYTPNLNDNVKLYDYSNYYLYNNSCRVNSKQCASNSKINVIITGETNGFYEIQLDTPMNKGAAGNYYYKKAEKGSWPNYNNNQNSGKYVRENQVIPYVDYGNFDGQQAWTPMGHYGVTSLNMLNDAPLVSPGNGALPEKWEEYWTANNVKHIKYYRYGILVNHHIFTYENNLLKTQEIFTYLPNGDLDYKSYLTYDNNQTERTNKKIDYYNGVIMYTDELVYDENGEKMHKIFKPLVNGVLEYTEIIYYINQEIDYIETTKYKNGNEIISIQQVDYYQGKITYEINKPYIDGNLDYIETIVFNSDGSINQIEKVDYYLDVKYFTEVKIFNNGNLDYITTNHYNNDKVVRVEKVDYNNGQIIYILNRVFNNAGKEIENVYTPYINGQVDYVETTKYDTNGRELQVEKVDYYLDVIYYRDITKYDTNGKVKEFIHVPYIKGQVDYAETTKYNINGQIISKEYTDYYLDVIYFTNIMKFNNVGNKIEYIHIPYINGQVDYVETTYFDNNGDMINIVKVDYYLDVKYYEKTSYFINNNLDYINIDNFVDNRIVSNENIQYINGLVDYVETTKYNNNGQITSKEYTDYYLDIIYYTNITKFNNEGNKIEYIHIPYINGLVDYVETTKYNNNEQITSKEYTDYYLDVIYYTNITKFNNAGNKIEYIHIPYINGQVDYVETRYFNDNGNVIRVEKIDYYLNVMYYKEITEYDNSGIIIGYNKINYR